MKKAVYMFLIIYLITGCSITPINETKTDAKL